MAVEGWRWAPKISSNVACDMKPRVIDFGDGYAQRNRDSFAALRSWDLTFESSPGEATAMQEFLRARGGVQAFDWQDPDTGLPVVVVCDSYTAGPANSKVRFQVRARFQEVRVAP